jgi:hypothetical protein
MMKPLPIASLILGIFFLFHPTSSPGDEPPLPAGLGGTMQSTVVEPDLPDGLFDTGSTGEPALPAGLSGNVKADNKKMKEEPFRLPFDFSGFGEGRIGARTQDDPYEKDLSIGEIRLQLEGEKGWDRASIRIRTDFLYDPVYDHQTIDLETGQGWLDLREARFVVTPLDFMDLKIGRQILTWGTGDMLFINDMFPKDWQSFFIGRDTEYLKAPSDAAGVSIFTDLFNTDLIYTPRFNADRYINGSRLSYYNPMLGRIAGRDAIIQVENRNSWFTDDELALRLSRNIGGYEAALYGYRGYWKSPAGMDPATGKATFPRLAVYGGSLRGAAGPGIANLEFGYYDSEQNQNGSDPFVNNSEIRFLAGYEQEIATNFTAGLQYYLEYMLQYDQYRDMLPSGQHPRDEARHVLTLRLTQMLMQQNLKLSFFGYYSPSDKDFYFRPNIHYKIDDHWSAEIGGNIFWGENDWTFFGQFRKDTNIYTGIRYGF